MGLQDGGLVERRPDPDDGRATQVQATPQAHEMMTGLGSSRFAQLHARLSALTDADRDLLLRAVPVLEALAADEPPTG